MLSFLLRPINSTTTTCIIYSYPLPLPNDCTTVYLIILSMKLHICCSPRVHKHCEFNFSFLVHYKFLNVICLALIHQMIMYDELSVCLKRDLKKLPIQIGKTHDFKYNSETKTNTKCDNIVNRK